MTYGPCALPNAGPIEFFVINDIIAVVNRLHIP